MRQRQSFGIGLLLAGVLLTGAPAGAGETRATAATTDAKVDQSAGRIGGQAGLQTPFERRMIAADSLDGVRVGGQAGLQTPVERRTIAVDSMGGMRVGGQAGLQTPVERRTIAVDSMGGVRVGSQVGQERDPEKPDSEAK